MAVFNGMFPIIAGKEDQARAFAKECMGPRKDAYEALQLSTKTRRETWSYNQTPMGDFILVWFEHDGGDEVFETMATNDDEFTVWFRGQVLEICGVDMADPNGPPPPEVLVDWSA